MRLCLIHVCFGRTEKAFLLQLLDCDYPGFSVLLSSVRLVICVCVCQDCEVLECRLCSVAQIWTRVSRLSTTHTKKTLNLKHPSSFSSFLPADLLLSWFWLCMECNTSVCAALEACNGKRKKEVRIFIVNKKNNPLFSF